MSFDDDWFKDFEATLQSGPRLIATAEDFNRVCDHIGSLLSNSAVLFRQGSFPLACFMAITALEETAKAHVGTHRKGQALHNPRKDPLFQHRPKHRLVAAPTIGMGERLARALGRDRVAQLLDEARRGRLVQVRESCLYFDLHAGAIRVPNDHVSRERAKELLLLAIEAFDDALIGLTNHSYDVGQKADRLFVEIAPDFPSSAGSCVSEEPASESNGAACEQ